MNQKNLNPVTHVKGSINLPGSKSITNRILLMSALCNGQTIIKNPLKSDDTSHMLKALKLLGLSIQEEKNNLLIQGCNQIFPNLNTKLFLGNAGTAFRPLTAVLSVMNGSYEVFGVSRMHERPIKDLVDALHQMGAKIEYLKNSGFPPIKILPSNISCRTPIKIKGDVSSQFLTALLMACPLTNQDITIEVEGDLISKPYIDITLKLLQKYSIHYENLDWKVFRLNKGSCYVSPGEIWVEGDASSASYFFAAGAILGNIEVHGINANSIQGDLKFLNVIKEMGAEIEYLENSIKVKHHEKLKGLTIDCKEIPDAAMTLAVMAIFSEGETCLKNIGSWRVKETDRIYAMETELKKIGANVKSTEDSITITPPLSINDNVIIDTYDDHRMAMCFSLITLANKTVIINDPECVNKTYPKFFKDLELITA